MDASHAANIHVSDRTIDSHIRNIRAKFAAAGSADDRSRPCTASASGSGGAAGEADARQMAAAHRPGGAGHPADRDGAAARRAVLLPPLREPADPPDRGRADRPGCGDRRDLCARGARGSACRRKARRRGRRRARPQRPAATAQRARRGLAVPADRAEARPRRRPILGPRPDALPATPDPAFAAIGARLATASSPTRR